MIYKFKVFPSTPLGCTVLHGFLEAVEPVSVGAGGAGGEKQGTRGHARGGATHCANTFLAKNYQRAELARPIGAAGCRHAAARARDAGPAAACPNDGWAELTSPASLSSRDAVGWRQLRRCGR